MDFQEFTPQQYRKFNGQSIMLALDALGGSASADDLANHIGTSMDQPTDIVRAEVSHVLRRGIANGFFQRRGKKYCLFNEGNNVCDIDSSTRKRKIDLSAQMQTDGSGKRVRLSKQQDVENGTQSELSGQTIDDLQVIIEKANEDTRKATIVAAEAAKRAKLAATKIQEIVESESGSSS